MGRLPGPRLINSLLRMTDEHPTSAIPPARDIPRVPTDDGDELVFNNPWEAKVFALIIHLYQQGHFTWPEWAEQLGQEIKAAGGEDDGSQYYLLWLTAAEKLIAAKSICAHSELVDRKTTLELDQNGPAG